MGFQQCLGREKPVLVDGNGAAGSPSQKPRFIARLGRGRLREGLLIEHKGWSIHAGISSIASTHNSHMVARVSQGCGHRNTGRGLAGAADNPVSDGDHRDARKARGVDLLL